MLEIGRLQVLLGREELEHPSGSDRGCSCARGSPGAAQTFLTRLSSGAEQANKPPPLVLLQTGVFPGTPLHCKNKCDVKVDKLHVLAVLQH